MPRARGGGAWRWNARYTEWAAAQTVSATFWEHQVLGALSKAKLDPLTGEREPMNCD